MNTDDLLYTNKFVGIGDDTREDIKQDERNAFIYQNAKQRDIDNVRDFINSSNSTKGNYLDLKRKAIGWNKGQLGNQRPHLSDFTKDLIADTYDRKKISYVSIDSRDRDQGRFLKPNNFKIYLGKQFENIESMKIVEYNIPNLFYPINERNNKLAIFFLGEDRGEFVETDCNFQTFLLPSGGNLNISRVKRYIYFTEVPPGFYTVKGLEKELEYRLNKGPYIDNQLSSNTNSDNINYAKSIKVEINPITQKVRFCARKEGFRIKNLKSYRGERYIDFELDIPTYASTSEALLFFNNKEFNVMPISFPSIGGIPAEVINCQLYFWGVETSQKFRIITEILDGSGNIIPGTYRLYLLEIPDTYYDGIEDQFILANFSQELNLTTCPDLCDASVGRAQPFMAIFSAKQSIFETDGFFTNEGKQYVFDRILNDDCTSNSILQLLGWREKYDDVNLISDSCFVYPILTNYEFTQNLLIKTLGSILNNNNDTSIDTTFYNKYPTFSLPICRNSAGEYVFTGFEYVFIRLFAEGQSPDRLSSTLIKANSNISSVNPNQNLYTYKLDELNGLYTYSTPTEKEENIVKNQPEGSITLNKDTTNLFAKIKLTNEPYTCNNSERLLIDNIYYDSSVKKVSELQVQILDPEGRIINMKHNFNITLMIDEKLDLLKETLIDTRTGSVLSSGTKIMKSDNIS